MSINLPDASSPLLTISDAIAVIQVLDGPLGFHVTRRQLRHWLNTLALGVGRTATMPNAAHVLTAEDVAVARLILRLQRDHVAPRIVWGLFVLQRDVLHRALRSRGKYLQLAASGRAQIVEGPSSALGVVYAINDFVDGIFPAIAVVRTKDPDVWCGHKYVSAAALAAVASY